MPQHTTECGLVLLNENSPGERELQLEVSRSHSTETKQESSEERGLHDGILPRTLVSLNLHKRYGRREQVPELAPSLNR